MASTAPMIAQTIMSSTNVKALPEEVRDSLRRLLPCLNSFTLPRNTARDGKHRRQNAEEQSTDAASHDDDHRGLDEVGHHAQLERQLVFVSLRDVLQRARDVTGFFADLKQVDH